jgi:NagD protein
VHSEDTIMVGDTMATDIKGDVEAGLETSLVLTGVTQAEHVGRFPFQPTWVFDSVAEIPI